MQILLVRSEVVVGGPLSGEAAMLCSELVAGACGGQVADSMAEALIALVNLGQLAWRATEPDLDTRTRMERARSLRGPAGGDGCACLLYHPFSPCLLQACSLAIGAQCSLHNAPCTMFPEHCSTTVCMLGVALCACNTYAWWEKLLFPSVRAHLLACPLKAACQLLHAEIHTVCMQPCAL